MLRRGGGESTAGNRQKLCFASGAGGPIFSDLRRAPNVQGQGCFDAKRSVATLHQLSAVVLFLGMPVAPSSILAPSSKARSP